MHSGLSSSFLSHTCMGGICRAMFQKRGIHTINRILTRLRRESFITNITTTWQALNPIQVESIRAIKEGPLRQCSSPVALTQAGSQWLSLVGTHFTAEWTEAVGIKCLVQWHNRVTTSGIKPRASRSQAKPVPLSSLLIKSTTFYGKSNIF